MPASSQPSLISEVQLLILRVCNPPRRKRHIDPRAGVGNAAQLEFRLIGFCQRFGQRHPVSASEQKSQTQCAENDRCDAVNVNLGAEIFFADGLGAHSNGKRGIEEHLDDQVI